MTKRKRKKRLKEEREENEKICGRPRKRGGCKKRIKSFEDACADCEDSD